MSRPRILATGDHSAYHAGSAAAWRALTIELARHGDVLTNPNAPYDILVVNGEGSMHHGSGDFRKKMAELAAALESGREAHLVNSVWQENPADWDRTLARLASISVREPLSAADLRDRHGLAAETCIDASYHCPVDPMDRPLDCSGQEIWATDFYCPPWRAFARPTGGYISKFPYFSLSDLTWSAAVNAISTMGLLVTGRHHAVYAAARARTPFLALRGNTHKIDGLIEMSGLPIPLFDSLSDVGAAIRWPFRNRALYDEFFDWIAAQPAWRFVPGDLSAD